MSTIAWGPASVAGSVEHEQPNVVLIALDDADFDLIDDPALDAYFPNIATHLRDEGMRLRNLHVTTPRGGPSRAALLRSQFARNSGVLVNRPEPGLTGGFDHFYDNGYASDELGRWLQDAGYTTMFVGKYHNDRFPQSTGDNRYAPPGWDEFYATRGSRNYAFTQVINGQLVGPTAPYPNQFRTDVEATQARGLLRSNAGDGPMFLYLGSNGPRTSPNSRNYADRHADLFPGAEVPRTPDFNEADVSDKPPQIAALPLYEGTALASLDERHRRRLQSMVAVDEMIGSLVAELDSTGELDDTYIMLTSINGYSQGHNRLEGKSLPYDRMTRVGMLVRGPGVPAGVESDDLLTSVDIAPTIVDLAGADMHDWADGRSFASTLGGPAGGPAEPRWITIENWGSRENQGVMLDTEFRAIRSTDVVYVEWANGDREYYDLGTDPYQLDNIYPTLTPALQADLAAALDAAFDACTGAVCDNAAPQTTVIRPVDRGKLRQPTRIIGWATDDTGVDRVELIIRDRRNSRYFDGTAFRDEFATVDARLEFPGSPSTKFRKRLRIPNVPIDIFARAYDEQGTSDPEVERIRQNRATDNRAPATRINRPVNGASLSGRLNVLGAARDNKGIDRVMIVVKDRRNDLYWNGTSFQPGFTRVRADLARPGKTRTRFFYQASLPPGEYITSARAYDIFGNFTNPPPNARFTVR
ncbi:MAG: sulfatase [Acidimicrobiia bacterium]|nr:sulfatase [Acidimicrobiia bacterium]